MVIRSLSLGVNDITSQIFNGESVILEKYCLKHKNIKLFCVETVLRQETTIEPLSSQQIGTEEDRAIILFGLGSI